MSDKGQISHFNFTNDKEEKMRDFKFDVDLSDRDHNHYSRHSVKQ